MVINHDGHDCPLSLFFFFFFSFLSSLLSCLSSGIFPSTSGHGKVIIGTAGSLPKVGEAPPFFLAWLSPFRQAQGTRPPSPALEGLEHI